MSLTSDNALIPLIGDIYEASYQPGHWDNVLAGLCRLIGAKSGGLLMEDKTRRFRAAIGTYNIPGIPKMAYRLGLGKQDVVFRIQASQPVGCARQVANHEEMRQSNPFYFQLFMRPNDLGYIAAINFFNDETWHVGIGLHRSFQADPFGNDELRLLDTLAPHFQRSLLIQRELHAAHSRERLLKTALSRLMVGVVVLDADDRVTYRNVVAETLFSRHKAIRIIGERLQIHDRKDAQALAAMLATLRDRDTHDGQRDLALGLRHPDRPHPLIVMGATSAEGPRFHSSIDDPDQIVLYISDPDSPVCAPHNDLLTVFGLSPREAEVAIALVNGLSIQDISAQNEISHETVRSQLKSIFSKLQVNKQQEVVRTLLNGILAHAP